MSEQVPKFLALNGQSDAMYDERTKVLKSRVHPNDSMKEIVNKMVGNKGFEYLNKHGMLLHCLEKDIGIKTLSDLNQQFTSGKQQQHPLGLTLSQSPLMISCSPTQQHIAIVTSNQILVFKTVDLRLKKQICTIKLNESITDIQWTLDNGILYWRFQSKSYHYLFATSKSYEVLQNCTSAQLINNHIIATSQYNVNIFDLDYKLVNKVQYPDQNYTGSDFYGINMEDTISIVKLNNLQSNQFKVDDIYAFIEVYYPADQNDDLPANKYLFYARGDLRTESVDFLGGQLLYNNKNEKQLYFKTVDDQQKKTGFSVKYYIEPKLEIFVFSIEKCDNIYVVDLSSKQFEKIRLVDFGKYDFSFDGHLIGFCLLKNMLKFEKEYEGKNSDLIEAVTNFKGRFMNIGIKSRDKDMMVPFPLSILAWNTKGVQSKQYLVLTNPNYDAQDQMQDKIKKMKQYKDSSAIVEPSNQQNQGVRSQNTTKQNTKPNQIVLNNQLTSNKIQTKMNFDFTKVNTSSNNIIKPSQTSTSSLGSGLFGTNLPTGNSIFSNQNTTTLKFPTQGLFGNHSNTNTLFTNTKQTKVDNNLSLNIKPLQINPLLRPIGQMNINPFQSNNPTATKKQQTKTTGLFSGIQSPVISKEIITKTTGTNQTPKDSILQKKQQTSSILKGDILIKKQFIVQPPKIDKTEKYIKSLQKSSNDFKTFLKYISKFGQYQQDDQRFEESLLSNKMINLLNELQKQQQIIQLSIFHIQLLTKGKHSSKLSNNISLNFNQSESSSLKIEELIRNKLDQYNQYCQKVGYIQRRFSTNQAKAFILKNSKPQDISSQLNKIISRQTTKIKNVQSIIQPIIQRKQSKQNQTEKMIKQKRKGVFEFNIEISSQESESVGLSFEDVLLNHIPIINHVYLSKEEIILNFSQIDDKEAEEVILNNSQKEKQKKAQKKSNLKIKQEQKKSQKPRKTQLSFSFNQVQQEEDEDSDIQLPSAPQNTKQISSIQFPKIEAGSLFGKTSTNIPLQKKQLSDTKEVPQTSNQKKQSLLFGSSKPSTSLFGQKKQQNINVDSSKATSIQSKPTTSLFDNKPKQTSPSIGSGLFANISPVAPASKSNGGLFGNTKAQNISNQVVIKKPEDKSDNLKKETNLIDNKPQSSLFPPSVSKQIQKPLIFKSEPAVLSDVQTALINKQKSSTDLTKPQIATSNNANIFEKDKSAQQKASTLFNNLNKQAPSTIPPKSAANIFGNSTSTTTTTTNIFGNNTNTSNNTNSSSAVNTNIFNNTSTSTSNTNVNSIFNQKTATIPANTSIFNNSPSPSNPILSNQPSPTFNNPVFGQSSFGQSTFGSKPAASTTSTATNFSFNLGNTGDLKSFGNVSNNNNNNIFQQNNVQSFQSNPGSGNFLGLPISPGQIQQPSTGFLNFGQNNQQQGGFQPQGGSMPWNQPQQQNNSNQGSNIFKPRK